jgi:predicted nucleotidyltransferase
MSSAVHKLTKAKLINPPGFLCNNLCYEVTMGSRAYGVNNEENSDHDIYGFCIPPKEVIFPHLAGIIPGFGSQGVTWEQYQHHHVLVEDKEYDFTIYNIVKYFQLCMENNPNMLDSLFVPQNCVLHSTQIGNLVRDNRKLFLSKLIWKKFVGYAYSQLHKIDIKEPIGKRLASVEQFGYDVKYAYHLVRLLNEAKQILSEGDLDLLRSREELKSIRRGEWTEDRVRKHFENQMDILEDMHNKSVLPEKPDEGKIKEVLLACLEIQYGSLSKTIIEQNPLVAAFRQIEEIINKVRRDF